MWKDEFRMIVSTLALGDLGKRVIKLSLSRLLSLEPYRHLRTDNQSWPDDSAGWFNSFWDCSRPVPGQVWGSGWNWRKQAKRGRFICLLDIIIDRPFLSHRNAEPSFPAASTPARKDKKLRKHFNK